MQLTINDNIVIIPSTLSELTLGQRIDFQNLYGQELSEMAQSISEMPDGMEKELEEMQFRLESALRSLSFFAGSGFQEEEFGVESLRNSQNIDELLNIYFACSSLLLADEESMVPQTTFVWNDEVWCLHPYELKHGDKMTTGEFVDAKQMLLNMEQLGKGKWEVLLPLCAVYLHKEGEVYQESFLYEGSDRLQLMRDLPMDIALQVGFFLACSLSIYTNTLASSKSPG